MPCRCAGHWRTGLIAKARLRPEPNLQARDDSGHASLMAGMAFGNAGVGAVVLAYLLGGRLPSPTGSE